MLTFLAVVFVVFTTHKLTTAQQVGCSGPQVQSLIASNVNDPQGTATITLQSFRVVCMSSSGIRNQYRFVSIVANYSVNEGTLQYAYGQFEFECDASTSNAWSYTGNLLDAPIFNRVTNLTANSPAINATNRTDCSYCLNSGSMSPPRFTDTANHCSACSGCAQPRCYITDTSLPPSGNNFTSVCCNYYMSDGITCTTACPPSSYPDGNKTCVPCSLTCQNGGTLRSDSCACNCTAVSTGSDCSAQPAASPNQAKCDSGCIAGAIIVAVLGTILLAGIVAAVIVGVYFATRGAGAATQGVALSEPHNDTSTENRLYQDPKIGEDSVAQ